MASDFCERLGISLELSYPSFKNERLQKETLLMLPRLRDQFPSFGRPEIFLLDDLFKSTHGPELNKYWLWPDQVTELKRVESGFSDYLSKTRPKCASHLEVPNRLIEPDLKVSSELEDWFISTAQKFIGDGHHEHR